MANGAREESAKNVQELLHCDLVLLANKRMHVSGEEWFDLGKTPIVSTSLFLLNTMHMLKYTKILLFAVSVNFSVENSAKLLQNKSRNQGKNDHLRPAPYPNFVYTSVKDKAWSLLGLWKWPVPLWLNYHLEKKKSKEILITNSSQREKRGRGEKET